MLAPQIKQAEVRSLLFKYKIGVLGLLETRVKEENHKKIFNSICDWRVETNYADAYNGRVWVIWDPSKVLVEELNQGEQFIHCRITILDTQIKMLATFVYAQNESYDIIPLWNSLAQIAVGIQEP